MNVIRVAPGPFPTVSSVIAEPRMCPASRKFSLRCGLSRVGSSYGIGWNSLTTRSASAASYSGSAPGWSGPNRLRQKAASSSWMWALSRSMIAAIRAVAGVQ